MILPGESSGSAFFWIGQGQTHQKVVTQSLRSNELELYDSGTAEIQSPIGLHRCVLLVRHGSRSREDRS